MGQVWPVQIPFVPFAASLTTWGRVLGGRLGGGRGWLGVAAPVLTHGIAHAKPLNGLELTCKQTSLHTVFGAQRQYFDTICPTFHNFTI